MSPAYRWSDQPALGAAVRFLRTGITIRPDELAPVSIEHRRDVGMKFGRKELLFLALMTLAPSDLVAGDQVSVDDAVHAVGLRMAVGQVQVVRTESSFANVIVGLKEVANITTLTDRSIAITAFKNGITSISLLDEAAKVVGRIEVSVGNGEERDGRDAYGRYGEGTIRVRSWDGRRDAPRLSAQRGAILICDPGRGCDPVVRPSEEAKLQALENQRENSRPPGGAPSPDAE